MKIAHVIPITKGVIEDDLSYFTNKEMREGSLVTIPARKKFLPAIVSSVQDIAEEKLALKNAEFRLKPIKSVVAESFLPEPFVEAIKEISKFFISPLGVVVKDFIPQSILSLKYVENVGVETREDPSRRHEVSVMQAPTTERMQYYKSIVREEFAKNHSVFILFPLVAKIHEFGPMLGKGIENYTFTFHSKLSEKKIKDLWQKALREVHPILVIATRSFLSLPRNDIRTLIMDSESSPAYKGLVRPYIDYRTAVEIISRKLKLKLIFGDTVLRTESYYRERSGEIPSAVLSPARITSGAIQDIVEMNRAGGEDSREPKKFRVISEELIKIIADAHIRSEKIILFVNRRGYSTSIACHDCYRNVLCGSCSTPFVIHKGRGGGDVLICHKCAKERPIPESCPYCGSWNMQSFGIGIQKVEEEVKSFFPEANIFRLDGDMIKTQRDGEDTVLKFLAAPGGILLTTEILLSFLFAPVECIAVVSIDAMFAFPDFNMNERIFRLLLELRLLSRKSFLIQTRLGENKVFDYVLKGNISGFYREEIEDRKSLGYPPFKVLVKATYSDADKARTKEESKKLQDRLSKWDVLTYPAFISKIKGMWSTHLLLKIDRESWPHKENELYGILKSLEPSWRIDVNPDSLL